MPCSLSSFRQQQHGRPWTYMWEQMSSASDFYVWPLHKTKVSHSSDTHTWSQTLVSHLTTNTKVIHSSDTHTWPQTLVSHLSTTQRSVTLQTHTHLTSDSCVSPQHNTKVGHSSDTHTLDLRPLCLTSAQHKSQSLFRHTHTTSDSCVLPLHNTKVSHSSDTHTWPQTLVFHLSTTQRSVTHQTHTVDLRLLCLTLPQDLYYIYCVVLISCSVTVTRRLIGD